MNRIRGRLAVAAGAAILAACGGSGGTTVAGIGGSGTTRDVVSVGTVTAFGSVFVNGVRFETTGAVFDIDGSVGTQDDLAPGDVVIVVGRLDESGDGTGVATQIVFDDLVEGPISAGSIDVVAGRFVVLGQTVIVTTDTSLDDSIQPAAIAGLADGDIVEVSGFRDADGSILATRIEPKPTGQPFEVTGRVSNLDEARFTFAINALDVDYSGALVEGFDAGAVVEGALVEVRGSSLSAGGALIATRVENRADEFVREAGDRLEIEGLVTRFAGSTDFDVAGLAVTTTAQSVFENGVAADLGLNVKVEVEGRFDSAGVLVADTVGIRRARQVRVTAVVDSSNAQTGSFAVLGISVATDSLTRIEDKSGQALRPFAVADLALGDYVEVRGSPAGATALLAGLVERHDLGGSAELRGFVTSESGTAFEILGVTISTSATTRFRDENDALISSTIFFDRIGPGSLVDVDGFEVGVRSLTAEEVEIELE